MNDKKMRMYALSLLFLAIAVGSLARTLHVADSIRMAMSGVSILLSLSAIVLIVKSSANRRRPVVLALVAAAILAAVPVVYIWMRH